MIKRYLHSNSFLYLFLIITLIYNIPNIFTKILLPNIFDTTISYNGGFANLISSLFIFRPYDPFTISVELCIAIFIVSLAPFKWVRLATISIFLLCYLFQYYAYSLIIFFYRPISFTQDIFFLKQIPLIINSEYFLILFFFIIYLIVTSYFLVKFTSRLFKKRVHKKYYIIYSLGLILIILWNYILIQNDKNHSLNTYFYPVKIELYNIFNYFQTNKMIQKTKNNTTETEQKINFKDHLNKNKPDVFIILIESYGDIENIFNQSSLNTFGSYLFEFNQFLRTNNLYSFSGYSHHTTFGSFASLMEVLHQEKLSQEDLSNIKGNIKNNISKTHLQSYFFKNDYLTTNIFSSINRKSFEKVSYTPYDMKQYLNTNKFLLLDSFQKLKESTVNFSYPDHEVYRYYIDNIYNKNHSNFLALITSNSHMPFYYFDINTIKTHALRNHSVIDKLDNFFKIKSNKFNFNYLKKKYSHSTIYKFLTYLYSPFRYFNYYISYPKAILYQFKAIEFFLKKIQSDNFILIFTGDHQPHLRNFSSISPIHIITNNNNANKYYLNSHSFTKEIHINKPDFITSHYNIGYHLVSSIKYNP